MKIASVAEIDREERALIASGVPAEHLMEDVALRIAEIIRLQWGTFGKCVAYLGKGNNAGDALVVLRYLREWGWKIGVRAAYPDVMSWSPLAQLQWIRLGGNVEEDFDDASCSVPIVLLDGLVGLGARGPLKESCLSLAREMNERRSSGRCTTVAIDFPSGIDGDTGEVYDGAVFADISVVIGGIKKGLVEDGATGHVGRIYPLPLRGLDAGNGEEEVADPAYLASLLGRRPYEWYKGNAGRVSVVAGSPGMIGAARLCSQAALRAGAGMVTLFALPDIYSLLAMSSSPEIMVKPISSYREVLDYPCDVLLAGPGVGTPDGERQKALLELVLKVSAESILVLDADGLNLIAREGLVKKLGSKTLITPHVGEMERLLPKLPGESRRLWAERFRKESPALLLLKGARTLIAQTGHPLRYNSTGGPCMGTAGQGDVLAGICAGLCAQGLDVYEAASLGAWLCGRGSELAISSGRESEQSLTAGDTLAHLGRAFQSLFVQGV